MENKIEEKNKEYLEGIKNRAKESITKLIGYFEEDDFMSEDCKISGEDALVFLDSYREEIIEMLKEQKKKVE